MYFHVFKELCVTPVIKKFCINFPRIGQYNAGKRKQSEIEHEINSILDTTEEISELEKRD